MSAGLPHPLTYSMIIDEKLGLGLPPHVYYMWLAMIILFTCAFMLRRATPAGARRAAERVRDRHRRWGA
jgi:hypothetical protein